MNYSYPNLFISGSGKSSTGYMQFQNYIETYKNAPILLDQVYSYDQGYKAHEAMAKEKWCLQELKEWLDYYNLKEDTVAINVLPNAQKIARKLEWLILNPDKIMEISQKVRAFIEKEHHYSKFS